MATRTVLFLERVSRGLTSASFRQSPLLIYLFPIIASVIPVLGAVWISPYRHDDVYITLTFARNIAAGEGFVYNGGTPVLGTTTPLLALLVAGLSRVLPGISLVDLATRFGVVTWIASAWLLAALWRKLGGDHWSSAIMALLMLTQFNLAESLGTEIPLFQFLLVATLYASLTHRPGLTGLGLGLLYLTRGEGILLAPILLLWDIVSKRRIQWKLVVVLAPIVLLWSGYAFLIFGNVVPSTLTAKIAQSESHPWPSFRNLILIQWLPNWLFSYPFGVLAVLAALGLFCALWLEREWLILLAWVVGYVVGNVVINEPIRASRIFLANAMRSH